MHRDRAGWQRAVADGRDLLGGGSVRACLTPREQRIILLRYGLGNRKPLTQREIAVQCGISRSYVSRIEKRALQKLEDALTKET